MAMHERSKGGRGCGVSYFRTLARLKMEMGQYDEAEKYGLEAVRCARTGTGIRRVPLLYFQSSLVEEVPILKLLEILTMRNAELIS